MSIWPKKSQHTIQNVKYKKAGFHLCAVVSHQLIKLQLICHSSIVHTKDSRGQSPMCVYCVSNKRSILHVSMSQNESSKVLFELCCAKNLYKKKFFIAFATSMLSNRYPFSIPFVYATSFI